MSSAKVSPKPFSVAIIGAGIGGLCTAIALLKYPHIDVQVYEAAPTFGEIGAGVGIAPNAQQALELIAPEARAAYDKHATGNMWPKHAKTLADYVVVSFIFFRAMAYPTNPCIFFFRAKANMRASSSTPNSMPRANKACIVLTSSTSLSKAFRRNGHTSTNALILWRTSKAVPLSFISKTAQRLSLTPWLEPMAFIALCVHTCWAKKLQSLSSQGQSLIGLWYPWTKQWKSWERSLQATPFSCAGEVGYPSFLQTQASAIVVERAKTDKSKGKASLSYPTDGGHLLNVVLFDFEQETWEHEKWVLPADPEALRRMFSTWGASSRALVEVSQPSTKTPYFLIPQLPARTLLDNANRHTAPPRHPQPLRLGHVGPPTRTNLHQRAHCNDGRRRARDHTLSRPRGRPGHRRRARVGNIARGSHGTQHGSECVFSLRSSEEGENAEGCIDEPRLGPVGRYEGGGRGEWFGKDEAIVEL